MPNFTIVAKCPGLTGTVPEFWAMSGYVPVEEIVPVTFHTGAEEVFHFLARK